MKLFYDLHIHSCLSPCGDMDMTPNNIVNMAKLLELDAIAVSDHNSAKNLPATAKLAEQNGLLLVPAIEACSAEEVHLLCLFQTLEGALSCSELLESHLPDIPNDPEIFGRQVILDEEDHPIGEEKKLLINALDLGIDRLLPLVRECGGLVIPAHVDKNAYSILSNLGYIPPEYGFSCIEVKHPPFDCGFQGKTITNSDAHYLEHIHEREYALEVKTPTVSGILDALGG